MRLIETVVAVIYCTASFWSRADVQLRNSLEVLALVELRFSLQNEIMFFENCRLWNYKRKFFKTCDQAVVECLI